MFTIAHPTSLAVYRDGGSMSVSFLDTKGMEHTLLFPVQLAVSESLKVECVGYFPPCLERCIRTSRISPITGLESIDSTTETESLSWEQARAILAALSPMMGGFDSDYAYVFPKMVQIAADNGVLSERGA